MDSSKKYIQHLSVCSGLEGMGLGLRRIFNNVREIAYIERDVFCQSLLVKKMEEGKLHPAPIFSSLERFPFYKFRGKVSILTAGIPCQPHSRNGKRKGHRDERDLSKYLLDGIRACKPASVFLENVSGIITTEHPSGKSFLHYVLCELEQLGYRTTGGLFTAAETKSPHLRQRVFVLADSRHSPSTESEQQTESWSNWISEPPEGPHEFSTKGEIAEGQEGGYKSWPSRPDEDQYEWEPLRTIKRGLDRKSDGHANRVDRIYALGNAIVPQQAETAFRVLAQRLNNYEV